MSGENSMFEHIVLGIGFLLLLAVIAAVVLGFIYHDGEADED